MKKAVATAATLTTTTALAISTASAAPERSPTMAPHAQVEPAAVPAPPELDAADARVDRLRADAAADLKKLKADMATAATRRASAARAAHAKTAARTAAHRRTVIVRAHAAARTERASRSRRAPAAKPAPTWTRNRTSASLGALSEAPSHAGAPYQWGAEGPRRFDCSGFIVYLFAQQGVALPRTSESQYAASSKVRDADKRPGDLIFTYGSGGVHHVGLYAGNGEMWAAPQSGDVVRKQSLGSRTYYVGRVT